MSRRPSHAKKMNRKPIRILVVDDTAIYRKIVSEIVRSIPGTVLLDTAHDGNAALRKIEQLNPDLVLLDVEMPGLDGLSTLEIIRKRFEGTGVVMVSGAGERATDITIRALQAGAFDFVAKPRSRSPAESRDLLLEALSPVIELFRNKKRALVSQGSSAAIDLRAERAEKNQAKAPAQYELRGLAVPERIGLVAIGVSTGGPRALAQVIPRLPGDFGVPILIVQHMPPGFTRSLAAQLDKSSPLSVKEAEDMEVLEAGRVLIAPGGRHMVVRRKGIELAVGLTDSPPVKSCRPSVDVLFRSLAGLKKDPVVTVTLTGMGDDGADGLKSLVRHGSYNIVQDQSSCVVFGMPKAVIEGGLADEILPPREIARRLTEIAGKKVRAK